MAKQTIKKITVRKTKTYYTRKPGKTNESGNSRNNQQKKPRRVAKLNSTMGTR